MKSHRLLHFVFVLAALATLVAGLWWSAGRMGAAAAAREAHSAKRAERQAVAPVPLDAGSLTPPPLSALDPEQLPERRALRVEVAAAHERLARAQAEALEPWHGEEHSEEARAAAMADFAQAHHTDIQAAADAQDRYLRPAEIRASNQQRTAFDSARARSSAIRTLVIKEGLSLEEAESRHPHPPTNP